MKSFKIIAFAVFFALTGTAYANIMNIPAIPMPQFIRPEAPQVQPGRFKPFVMPEKKKASGGNLENRLQSLQQEFLITRALEKSS